MLDNSLQLADGRTLGFAFYGQRTAEPVLYFHGTPSSRLEPLLLNNYNKDIEGLLNQYGLRLIAVDRPGMGLSSFNPAGTFSSFANDVSELLRALGISTCKLLCWSGGGPFALAMAYHQAHLITNVYIISAFTLSFSIDEVYQPMHGNKNYFRAAKYAPWLARWVLAQAAKSNSGKPIPQWISKLPDVDHRLMTDKATNRNFSKVTLAEACREGSRGVVYEAALYFSDAGYVLQGIKQPVHFWRGNLDDTILPVHAKAVEQQVPNNVMHEVPGEGHLSLFVNRITDVLATVSSNTGLNS